MRMTRKFLALMVSGVLAVGLAGCSPAGTGGKSADSAGQTSAAESKGEEKKEEGTAEAKTDSGDKEPVRIGVIYSATGVMASGGIYMKQSIEMAAEEINAAGGVLGGRMIELVEDDDQSDQTTAINLMNKMGSDATICAVIGPHTSTNATAVSDTVKEFKIPYLTGGTSAKLKELDNEYMFKVRCNDDVVVNSAIKYMTETVGCKKLGILYINDEFGVGGKDIMVQYCKDNGIEYVEANHNATDQDLTAQILQMKQADVDGLIAWSSNVCPIVARQTSELGFDKPILMNAAFGAQDVLDSLPAEVTEGKMAATDATAEDTDPLAAEFVKKYSEKYGLKPRGDWANSYYGGMQVLKEAIEKAGSTDREAIQKAITEVKDIPSTLGNLQADENGCLVHECSIVKAVKKDDGKCVFELVEKVKENGY